MRITGPVQAMSWPAVRKPTPALGTRLAGSGDFSIPRRTAVRCPCKSGRHHGGGRHLMATPRVGGMVCAE